MACLDKELSILFTDDNRIAHLNNYYLGRSGPTNVLAFPMKDLSANYAQTEGLSSEFESPMLGDVVISVSTAMRESKELGEPLEHAIDRLLIHGLLHLLGYDHEKSAAEARRMEREEKRLMAVVKED